MPLDPEVTSYLAAAAAAGLPPFESLTPAEARANSERLVTAFAGPTLPVSRVEDITIPGPGGPIPARVYSARTDGQLEPVVAYFHGGGWVVGSLETHDVVGRSLATAAGCLVVAVDYRLAPENPYPAAIDDCWAAVEWLSEHAQEVGGDPSRLAVCGDSAGGNLAAAVALRARDRRLQIAAQQLVYPVLDHDLETSTYRANATGMGLTRSAMQAYWDHYVPDRRRRAEPDASPLRAEDVSGVAPALVVVCEFDPLLDEGVAYARRLEAAGVPVELSRYDGMIHGFIRMPAVFTRTARLHQELADHLRRAFGEAPP